MDTYKKKKNLNRKHSFPPFSGEYFKVRMYEDFIRLLFLHAHREASALTNELQEESDQFRFLHGACFSVT